MRFRGLIGRLFRSRFVRILGAAFSVSLLAPLPALALTFLTPWSLVSQVQQGTASPALGVFFADTIIPHGMRAAVQIDPGITFGSRSGSGSSQVTLEREFRVGPGDRKLQIQPVVNARFQNGSYVVSATVGHNQGNTFVADQSLGRIFRGAGNQPVIVLAETFTDHSLAHHRGQAEVVRVTIRYVQRPNGFWHDRSRKSGPASFHRFSSQPG
jgi:hypothetical protein